MFYVLQNESVAARRRVPILLTDAATGTTAQSGVALTTIYPYVNSNGGSFSGGAGTVANSGFGQYYYEFHPDEIDTLGLAGIHITALNCRDYDSIVQVAAFDMYSAAVGITAGAVWNYVLSNSDTAETNLVNASAGGGATAYAIAQEVWNTNLTTFNDTDLAGGMQKSTYDTVSGNLDGNISGIPTSVWNKDMTDFIGLANSAGDYLYQLGTGATGYPSGGSGLSAYDVWDFNITGFGQTGSAAEYVTQTNFTVGNIETYVANQTPQDVWTYAGVEGRTVTGGAVSSVTNPVTFSSSQYSAIASSVWNAGSRTITGGLADTVTSVTNPVSITSASMSSIAGTVWNSLVASYSTNGTFGLNILRSDDANKVGDVTLRSAGGINMVDADIHRIDNDVDAATNLKNILTGIGSTITGNIVGNVSGNVTGSVGSVTADVNVSTASMTGIAGTVWSYATRTLTSSGSGISAADVWNYADRTITGGAVTSVVNPVDVSASSRSSIASTVWNQDSSTYSAANNPFGSLVIIQNQVGETEERVIGVGATVWEYATRTLTSSATGISAYDVWNYVLSDSNTAETDLVNIASDTQTIQSDIIGIPNLVWSQDVSGYVTPGEAGYELSQASSGAGLTAGDVWSYATRTITGGIADTVTSLTNGVTVTTNNDKTGYELSGAGVSAVQSGLSTLTQAQVGTEVDSSLSDVGLTSTVTGRIDVAVSSRLATSSYVVPPTESSIAGTVWNYATRTLTSGGSGISAFDVWNYVLSDSNTAEVDLVQAASGAGLTAGDVWSYNSRTITGGIADTVSNVTGNVSGSVGSVVSGVTVTTNNDKTGYALSANQTFNVTGNVSGNILGTVNSVTGNVGGNVVGSVGSVTGNVSGNVVGSVGSVTGNVSGNVVGSVGSVTGNVAGTVAAVTGNVSGNVVGSVASVTNPVTFNSSQYASIASSVWNAATRTLTSGGSGISAADVWNYVLSDSNTAETDLVSAASGVGLTAGDVWSYASREITGGIANTVTSVTNGVTVTTNNDKTGYALSGAGVSAVQSGLSTLTQAQVGTEVDSSLSDVGLTSTVTGRIDVAVSSRLASSSYETPPTAASIASSVWSAGSRTITGGTVATVTNDVNVSTGSMTGIAGTVWNYSSRTITGGGGATAGDVWTYGTRSLTSGAGITVNAATNIINGPYFVKSNVDGQDGNLDVITGMVQDIQLTVTDAFGNPFDTTALGLAVNFYNQAGTLTTSYSTSELYGPAGLVQFTLDTAVTGTEGRYNLILSAAGAGNTIKFGPLTTLVRPY